MEILFGIHFDQGYYLDISLPENQNSFNKMITGPMGLLGLLERDLGLSGIFMTSLERKVRYREILTQFNLQNPDNLISKSFFVDPDGVTSELLQYRDQLVLAGWNQTITDISPKIDLLASIERLNDIPSGIEDRWRKVLKQIKSGKTVSLGFSKIILHESSDEMHPFFKLLFNLLTEKGVIIETSSLDYPIIGDSNLSTVKKKILAIDPVAIFNDDDKSSLQILRFKSDTDAAEFLASQKKHLKETVILNRDNCHFDEMLNSFGHPVAGSDQIDSNPSLIQLFRLISVLLIKPLNIHNLLSFLQVEINPVPAALRYQLMKVLKETGGMNNPQWEQTIKKFEFKKEDARNRVLNFLTIRSIAENLIECNIVIQLYHSLSSWAQERMILGDNPPSVTHQFSFLIDQCNAIQDILKDHKSPVISGQEIAQIINGIYEPQSFGNYVTQVDACNVMANPGQIINLPTSIIWLDFYNESMFPAYYNFLNAEEVKKLTDKGVHLWSIAEQSSALMKMHLKGILLPKARCILIVVEKAGDEIVTDHPVYSFLKSIFPDHAKITFDMAAYDPAFLESINWELPDMQQLNTTLLPEKKQVYQIPSGSLIPIRATESVSSMEVMIQNPFDWLFQYGLQIQPGNSYQLDDLFTTMGTVAHKFIEVLFQNSENDLNKADALLKEYETLLTSVVEGYGMILLLDENRFEFEVFKTKLLASVRNLIELLEINQLTVIGLEQSETAAISALGNQQVFGKIDLVLRTANGELAIFDLKWSRFPKKFAKMIRENKHIQLAVYKELLESASESNVNFVAYYSLSDAKLISTKKLAGQSVIFILETATSRDIVTSVKNSVEFRRNQFRSEVLEEAGGSDMKDLDYFQKQDTDNLVPLETEYNKPDIKKINAYSQYKTFKGEVN